MVTSAGRLNYGAFKDDLMRQTILSIGTLIPLLITKGHFKFDNNCSRAVLNMYESKSQLKYSAEVNVNVNQCAGTPGCIPCSLPSAGYPYQSSSCRTCVPVQLGAPFNRSRLALAIVVLLVVAW